MGSRLTEQDKRLAMEALNKKDEITPEEAKQRVNRKRKVYSLAQENKGEDRLTQKDIQIASDAVSAMDKMSALSRDKAKVQKFNKGSKKKMPEARDMAMGNKNIVYLGDPYMVDGKMYDPVKEHPEDYIRPKDAKTYSSGGEINVGKGGDYIKDLID